MFGIEKDFQNLMEQVYGPLYEPVKYETPMTKNEEEIEKVKAQIKVLQSKLSFLEELEKTKSPVEEAFKDAYGKYPVKDVSEDLTPLDNWNVISWDAFQKGYKSAQEDYKVGEYQETVQERGERLHNEMEKVFDGYEVVEYQEEPEENEWKSVALRFGEKLSGYLSDNYYELSPAAWFRWAVFTYGKTQQVKEVVRENLKWFEENPDKDPLDYVKPQTPEQVADGLKEAFREAVKQGVVSSTKSKTLTDLIYDWWSDVFTTHSDWDMETSIENLIDEISLWLPTEHETNSYKWNECIRMIREKLR